MTIGIDPGKDGAIAYILEDQLVKVQALRGLSDEDVVTYLQVMSPRGCKVFIEEVHASPQQGVVSAFTFGKGFGVLLGAVYALGFYVKKVRPVEWQGALGCLSGGDKKSLFEHARYLYSEEYSRGMFKAPQADAVLIARYGAKFNHYNRQKISQDVSVLLPPGCEVVKR